MKRSFYSMVSRLSGLPHVGLKVTMKNGSMIEMGEFNVKGNTLEGKNGKKARLTDVDYIEIDSK